MNTVSGLQQRSNTARTFTAGHATTLPHTVGHSESADAYKACCADCNKSVVEDKDRVIWAIYGKCRTCWSELMWQHNS